MNWGKRSVKRSEVEDLFTKPQISKIRTPISGPKKSVPLQGPTPSPRMENKTIEENIIKDVRIFLD